MDSTTSPSLSMCGCKGIRTCGLCEFKKDDITLWDLEKSEKLRHAGNMYDFCGKCCKAWQSSTSLAPQLSSLLSQINRTSTEQIPTPCIPGYQEHCLEPTQSLKTLTGQTCNHSSQTQCDTFSGVTVIENFVDEAEESDLCDKIYKTDFALSQSGRRKQDFGPKVNFKKRKLKTAAFTGLPSYTRFLYERLKQQEQLQDFEPVELCNLEYSSSRGAHIDPHFDDAWLWGERLLTLSLLADSTLSFTRDDRPDVEVRVTLPRRSLVIVQGPARHDWKHGIHKADVLGDFRIAMTFRELSPEFSRGGMREKDGSELLALALTFQGLAVGCS